MSYAILRTAKLKTIGNISGSLAHTYRTIETPNADSSRTHLNDNSLPSHQQALQAIKDKLPEKTRKNGVLCIEYLITASPEWSAWGTDKQNKYFDDAIQWLKDKHGSDNVVMTGIQLDETTPHLVAYVVPIDKKGKLNCRHFLGGREKMTAMQTDFANVVGAKYGLQRGQEGSRAKHEEVKKFYADITKGVEVELELPKPKTFELSVSSYRERVTSEVKEQLSDSLKSLENQLNRTKKEVKDAKKQLKKLSEETERYLKIKSKLPYSKREEFDKKIDKLATEIQQQRKQEFEQKRQQQEEKLTFEQKSRWTFDVELHKNKDAIRKNLALVDVIRKKVKSLSEDKLLSPINPYDMNNVSEADKFIEFQHFVDNVKKSVAELTPLVVEYETRQKAQPTQQTEKVRQERSGKGKDGGMDLG